MKTVLIKFESYSLGARVSGNSGSSRDLWALVFLASTTTFIVRKFNKKLFNNDDVYGNNADLFVCTEIAEKKSQEEDGGKASWAEVDNLPENLLQKKEKVKKTFRILQEASRYLLNEVFLKTKKVWNWYLED